MPPVSSYCAPLNLDIKIQHRKKQQKLAFDIVTAAAIEIAQGILILFILVSLLYYCTHIGDIFCLLLCFRLSLFYYHHHHHHTTTATTCPHHGVILSVFALGCVSLLTSRSHRRRWRRRRAQTVDKLFWVRSINTHAYAYTYAWLHTD